MDFTLYSVAHAVNRNAISLSENQQNLSAELTI
jgi:hypothetical protein